MCEYCKSDVNSRYDVMTYYDEYSIYIDGNGNLVLKDPRGMTMDDKINFCPMCGESLTEPRALTLEELKQRVSKPVWVRSDYGNGYCIVWLKGARKHMYFSKTGTAEGMTAMPIFLDDYGKTWFAYDREPTDTTIKK